MVAVEWIGFGNRGVIAANDPIEQEKVMKFNALLTNAVIFHKALDIAEIVRQLLEEGWEIDPEDGYAGMTRGARRQRPGRDGWVTRGGACTTGRCTSRGQPVRGTPPRAATAVGAHPLAVFVLVQLARPGRAEGTWAKGGGSEDVAAR
ncbi:Tn3 family transposase [Streptomyces sp. NPDC058694]|uniref:Tn3 family transposase n=1 Tax=Streptomyces sp. NPDC058694 TaxID=3346603 RepID=UPI00364805D8